MRVSRVGVTRVESFVAQFDLEDEEADVARSDSSVHAGLEAAFSI